MARKKKTPPSWSLEHEPRPAEEDIVDCGPEAIVAAGFTDGGFPYGVTVAEFRESSERDDPERGWALAKQVLRRGLGRRLVGGDDGIGWIHHLGSGLSYRAYSSECRIATGGRSGRVDVVVRLPRPDAPPADRDRARTETAVLLHLSGRELPFRTPRVLALVEVAAGTAVIETLLTGIPLEMDVSRNARRRPWDVVAEVAAACHAIDPPPGLAGSRDRREHAIRQLDVLDRLDTPEARAARAWAIDHLPPAAPSRLLHGDLLGQNILLPIEDGPPAVIDWGEAQLGDPAHDLAIVTRGEKKPFGSPRGVERLLEAYRPLAQMPVALEEVRIHELCLMAGFVLAEIERLGPSSAGADAARRRFANTFARAVRP